MIVSLTNSLCSCDGSTSCAVDDAGVVVLPITGLGSNERALCWDRGMLMLNSHNLPCQKGREKVDMRLGWHEHWPAIASTSACAAVCVKCWMCTTLSSITYTLFPASLQNLIKLNLLDRAQHSFITQDFNHCLHCMHMLARRTGNLNVMTIPCSGSVIQSNCMHTWATRCSWNACLSWRVMSTALSAMRLQ